jgi:hypothetical protein
VCILVGGDFILFDNAIIAQERLDNDIIFEIMPFYEIIHDIIYVMFCMKSHMILCFKIS